MSFIYNDAKGAVYAGYFLVNNEDCTRKTRELKQNKAVTAKNGAKYVPMGTVYPANDGTAEGIVYEDVDVTSGNMPGSVVLTGVVYENRLAEELDESARTALKAKGFVFMTEPEVVRPY